MLDPKKYPFCSEFYIVEKAVEIVVKIQGQHRRIRIEALYSPNTTPHYSTQGFIEEHITVQPTYPQEYGKFVREPEDVTTWVSYDLPWTSRDTADDAIAQALSLFGEYFKNSTSDSSEENNQ